MSRYRVDLAGGEVAETNEGDDTLYRDLSEASGLSDWLDSRIRAEQSGPETEQEPEQALGFFGVDELLKIAREDNGELPEQMKEQGELEEELRRRSDEDAFGPDPTDRMSDDELWASLPKDWFDDAS